MYDEWLCRLGHINTELQAVVGSLPSKTIDSVKLTLSQLDPQLLIEQFCRIQSIGSGALQAGVFTPLAELQIHGHGRGELALPFLVRGTIVNPSEGPIDIDSESIGKWHVKGCPYNGSSRAGASSLFSVSPLWDSLRKIGIPANELNEWSIKKVLSNVDLIIQEGVATSLEHLQAMLNAEVQKFAVGEARGIIFYDKGTYTFIERDAVGFGGVTQGRYRVTGVLDKLIKRSLARYRTCASAGCGEQFLLSKGESSTRCEKHRRRRKDETGIDSRRDETVTRGTLEPDREGVQGE